MIILTLILYSLDEEEEKRKTEMREAARKELDEWYKNHDEQVAKNRNANRLVLKKILPSLKNYCVH